MLVVISDLHFVQNSPGVNGALKFNKNMEPIAYHRFVNQLASEARMNRATHLDVVLAGDIFEMFKSPIWYEDAERPYIHLDEIQSNSSIEYKILRLLDDIAEEEHVGESLEILRQMQDHFDIPVKIHYLVGNHDRVVNATPGTRRKVRLLLGMEDRDDYIPHTYTYMPEGFPAAFIRHGHEYDSSNISHAYDKEEIIPLDIPQTVYDAPSLGDFLTLEFGNKLLYLFLQTYGPHAILNNEMLRYLYQRLVYFDDVRPLTSSLHFLLTTPHLTPKEAWGYLEPIFIEALDLMSENKFFVKEMRRYTPRGEGRAGSILTMLKLRPWRKGIPYWLIWRIARYISKNPHLPESGSHASREEAVYQNGSSVRCVISGHTHTPEISLINTQDGVERYHINTGTWRNVVQTSRDNEHFGRVKTLAHAVLYGPGENPNGDRGGSAPQWSFEFWAGYRQKFYTDVP
jgi:UDP-2,3-diacylglucosamine pyrophosphatase LpxH